jgi:hypothetical protein
MAVQRGLGRRPILKNRPLTPVKLFIKSFWKSRNLFSKRFLVAEGIG